VQAARVAQAKYVKPESGGKGQICSRLSTAFETDATEAGLVPLPPLPSRRDRPRPAEYNQTADNLSLRAAVCPNQTRIICFMRCKASRKPRLGGRLNNAPSDAESCNRESINGEVTQTTVSVRLRALPQHEPLFQAKSTRMVAGPLEDTGECQGAHGERFQACQRPRNARRAKTKK
jgi:hypothetical protein